MIVGALAAARVSPALRGARDQPLAIAAVTVWVITLSIGVYMLRTWIVRGGLHRQRATGVGVPPVVVFGHASAALSGLVFWLGFLKSGWDSLAWLGVLMITIAIALGIGMVTLWTPYPVVVPPGERSRGGPGERVPANPAERPVVAGDSPDTVTVTDEMIASLLAQPLPVRRRRKLTLLPLIPVVHGFAALATFMLAVLAAVNAR
jgi:hypothetical protein